MSPSGWSTEPEQPTADLRDATRGPRLQKVMAEAGVGSRRACEELIESGAVAVNGVVVTELPAWVDPRRDRITVEGEGIGRPEPHVYVMLFKPRGVVCTNDEDARAAAAPIDLVQPSEHAPGSTRSAASTPKAPACSCSPTTEISPTGSRTRATACTRPTR